jgi:hypothetical protein
MTRTVTVHVKQSLLTSWYPYRWSRNSPPYVIAGKFIALFTKAVHFYCASSQLIPTHPFLPVPCLLTICSYSTPEFPQGPVLFVQFPVFRNKYVSSKYCRHFSISGGWNSYFCYPPRTQTSALSTGLQNPETECKTVHLVALKMHRMDNFKTRSKPLAQFYRAYDVISFFELWFGIQKQYKSDFDES